jgi:hypothetical protein
LALKARRAIYRSIASRLERYLSLFATLSTDGGEHLLLAAFIPAATAVAATIRCTIATAAGTGVPSLLVSTAAVEATARFVGEALTGEEVLFTGGEREVGAAIAAG